LLASLLSFNIGVELGQLLVLLVLVPVLEFFFRVVVAERMGTIIASALVAHTGWHWMLERADRLSQYRIELPEWNLALAASMVRWLMLAVLLTGIGWWVTGFLKRRQKAVGAPAPSSAAARTEP